MKWRSSNTEFKRNSLEIINEYLEKLETIKTIKFKTKDKKLEESFENIKKSVFKGVKDVKFNIDEVLNKAEWDKLNIALFGETNAGKSTLLEVLSNGDGNTIGNGRKDFTQTVHIHKDKSINIIDMPGIEGKEDTVISSIKEAVNKVHIIFYVIGTNKEPEETTIRKIKEMLHDNMKVYTIINIRGRVSQYKRKFSKGELGLVDDNTRIVEERVKSKFREILGKNYVTNINVQAHLGLLANESLDREAFRSDQNKALELFKSKEKIIKFSELNSLNDIIADLSSTFNDEIRVSNIYKFLGLFGTIEKNILNEYVNFKSCMDNMSKLADNYLEEVMRTIKKYKGIIKRENKKYLDNLEYDLKNLLSTAIENKYSQNEMDSRFREIKNKSLENLNEEIKAHMNQMKKEILDKLKEFEIRLDIGIKYFNFEDSFDFESIIDSLKVDFKYVLGQIVDVGLSIAGILASFAINPFLGIATLLMGVIRKFFDWVTGDTSRKKREAFSKRSRKIELLIREIESKVESNQSKIFRDIDHKIKISISKIQKEIANYSRISDSLELQLSKIKTGSNLLSNYLLKDLIGPKVKSSYLDLEEEEGLIIGYKQDVELIPHLKKLLRLDKLYMVSSIKEWINNYDPEDNWDNDYNSDLTNKSFYKKSLDLITE